MDKGIEALKPGKYAILYRDNWDGEGDTYHTLANLEPDGRWLSEETGKELHEYEGDEILKAWPLVDGFENLSLVAELERAQQHVTELEKSRKGVEESLIWATDRIAELEASSVKLVNLPDAFAIRSGHPINENERSVMIPKDGGNWFSRLDIEHALRVAGVKFEGSE